ncbi:MAG: acyl-CoA thioesterase [Pseudomonadota bacterium]
MSEALSIDITFGDCDPAGIVFYPNAFRWMDAAFHNLLRNFGGHAELCRTLGAIGLGLIDVSARFRHPMRDGDQLLLTIEVADWSTRAFSLGYIGTVDGTLAFEGREVRALFVQSDDGLRAADVAPLKSRLEVLDER